MKTMAIRVFLRGGYLELEEATVVMRHGQPLFTAMPYNAGQNARERRNIAERRRNIAGNAGNPQEVG